MPGHPQKMPGMTLFPDRPTVPTEPHRPYTETTGWWDSYRRPLELWAAESERQEIPQVVVRDQFEFAQLFPAIRRRPDLVEAHRFATELREGGTLQSLFRFDTTLRDPVIAGMLWDLRLDVLLGGVRHTAPEVLAPTPGTTTVLPDSLMRFGREECANPQSELRKNLNVLRPVAGRLFRAMVPEMPGPGPTAKVQHAELARPQGLVNFMEFTLEGRVDFDRLPLADQRPYLTKQWRHGEPCPWPTVIVIVTGEDGGTESMSGFEYNTRFHPPTFDTQA